MLIPRLALGRADALALLLAHQDYLDDGVGYDLLARSDRVALAGLGGEVAFYALYLAMSYESDTPLNITLLVDDVRQPLYQTILVGAVPGAGPSVRRSAIVEVPLLVPFPSSVPGYASLGRFAPRGTWAQVEIVTGFPGADAFVQVDGIEIEYEVVREGKSEGANP